MITCWNEKVYWDFWRPITAIREGQLDGNPNTIGDPTWTPLLATPPYSDHTSGFNCASGAFMHTAKAFFGTNRMDFSLVKIAPNVPNVTRDYKHFTDVVDGHHRRARLAGPPLPDGRCPGRAARRERRQLDRRRNYFQPVDGKPKHARHVLVAQLSGANEVPSGDPDGFGFARLTVDDVTNEICYQVNVAQIAPATAAHIHRGAAGVAGPVVVPLKAPWGDGFAKGCVEEDAGIIAEILADPSGFYVNIHTADYPGGAVRGQLDWLHGKTR